MQFMLEDVSEEVTYPTESIFIQDGNALFHALNNLPPTFGAICLKIRQSPPCFAYVDFLAQRAGYAIDDICRDAVEMVCDFDGSIGYTTTTHNSSIRPDEGLTLETSAFQIFHGGNSTFINSFDKTNFLF